MKKGLRRAIKALAKFESMVKGIDGEVRSLATLRNLCDEEFVD
jgi:hypothetical protein